MKKNLIKQERLKRTKDINRVFSTYNKISGVGLKLLFIRNDFTWNRIAFTLSRKYGNAVKRNRAKRVIREIYRTNKHRLLKGYDMIIIIYPGKDDYSSREVSFLRLFSKANLLT